MISRVDMQAILTDMRQRRDMLVPAIQTIQNREGIDTTSEQAARAYDRVQAEKDVEVSADDLVDTVYDLMRDYDAEESDYMRAYHFIDAVRYIVANTKAVV